MGIVLTLTTPKTLGEDIVRLSEAQKQGKNSKTGNNVSGDGSDKRGRTPVGEKTRASNGLDYESNPKHTPGQQGSRRNAGTEPRNSLKLFEQSVPTSTNPNHRYTYDRQTGILHRFFNDGNGTWHWSGSTSQGSNSLPGDDVPIDIKRLFKLPRKGW